MPSSDLKPDCQGVRKLRCTVALKAVVQRVVTLYHYSSLEYKDIEDEDICFGFEFALLRRGRRRRAAMSVNGFEHDTDHVRPTE